MNRCISYSKLGDFLERVRTVSGFFPDWVPSNWTEIHPQVIPIIPSYCLRIHKNLRSKYLLKERLVKEYPKNTQGHEIFRCGVKIRDPNKFVGDDLKSKWWNSVPTSHQPWTLDNGFVNKISTKLTVTTFYTVLMRMYFKNTLCR